MSWFRNQGIQVNPVDTDAFRRKAEPLLQKSKVWKPSVYQRLKAMGQ